MSEIPDDIQREAYRLACDILHTLAASRVELIKASDVIDGIIAKAIHAERQRCASLAADLPLAILTATNAGDEAHKTTFWVGAGAQRDAIAAAILQPLPPAPKGGE